MQQSTSQLKRILLSTCLLLVCLFCAGSVESGFATTGPTTPTSDVILRPSDLQDVIPKTVFFRGQSAPVQLRNAGGIRFSDGMYVFATLVDTSGYSSGVQAKYQAYLISEVPLLIGNQHLAPGAYGIGFIADHEFLVMDLGAHDLFTVKDEKDNEIRRPTPLQVLAGGSDGEYRLYEGRDFIAFRRSDR